MWRPHEDCRIVSPGKGTACRIASDATVSYYNRGCHSADSYQLSELPEGYGLFLMKRKTETGTTAGKVKAETAIFVRMTLFSFLPPTDGPHFRDHATLRNSETFPSFCCMWTGCWIQAMTFKITVLVNARSHPHRRKLLRGPLPRLQQQPKLRLQGGNERMQIL